MSERIQHEFPPIRGEKNTWEYEHPNTGKIEYVYWDIHNIFSTRMRGRGVFHNASWEKCLTRYATRVSLSKLNLIKKTNEWIDAICEYIEFKRITFDSTQRCAKIFGITEKQAHKVFDKGIDVKSYCYKHGLSFTTVTRHWNDRY